MTKTKAVLAWAIIVDGDNEIDTDLLFKTEAETKPYLKGASIIQVEIRPITKRRKK